MVTKRTDKGGYFVSPYEGHEDVGRFMIRTRPVRDIMPTREHVSLWSVFIHEKYRGKKYGHVLMDDVLSEANAMSAKSMWLTVEQNNFTAKRLYMSHGFSTIGTRIERKHLSYMSRFGKQMLQDHLGYVTYEDDEGDHTVTWLDNGCKKCRHLMCCLDHMTVYDLCDDITASLSPHFHKSMWKEVDDIMYREV